MLRQPVRQERISQVLEYSLYFNRCINQLTGQSVTEEMLYNLRKDLREKGIADLSPYWDGLLTMKIQNPALKMSLLKAGGAHTSRVKTKTGESYQIIHVYPETTDRDVQSAFQRISKDMPKQKKTQGINEKLYEFIFQKLLAGEKTSQIIRGVYEELDYRIGEKRIREIVQKMKIGS